MCFCVCVWISVRRNTGGKDLKMQLVFLSGLNVLYVFFTAAALQSTVDVVILLVSLMLNHYVKPVSQLIQRQLRLLGWS